MKKIILTFSVASVLFACGGSEFDKNLLIGEFDKSDKAFIKDTVKLDDKAEVFRNQRLKTTMLFSADSTYIIKTEMFTGFDYEQGFDYKGKWILEGSDITLMDSDTLTYEVKSDKYQIKLFGAKDSIYLKKIED